MKVFAYSKGRFNRFMKEQGITDENIESFDIYAFISILDIAGLDQECYFEKEHSNLLKLSFGDFGEPEDKPGPGHFSPEQANQIIDFIEKHKDKQILIVHCTAGISRSGAVGAFINDLYGSSYKEFFNNNRQINPNSYVSRILREQYRKRFPDFYVSFDEAFNKIDKLDES